MQILGAEGKILRRGEMNLNGHPAEQGTQCTGKTENGNNKNPCQGKRREFGN